MSGGRVVRGVRGATTVSEDRPDLIVAAVEEMLHALMRENRFGGGAVVSAYFTATADLRSTFPARGARSLGWSEVPMICAQEIVVEGALPRCVRVLLHVEVPVGIALRPVYLRGAVALRPDLAGPTAALAG